MNKKHLTFMLGIIPFFLGLFLGIITISYCAGRNAADEFMKKLATEDDD